MVCNTKAPSNFGALTVTIGIKKRSIDSLCTDCVCMWVVRLQQTHHLILQRVWETEESNGKISRVESTLRVDGHLQLSALWAKSILCCIDFTWTLFYLCCRVLLLTLLPCIFYMIPNSTVDSRGFSSFLMLLLLLLLTHLLSLFIARNAWHFQVHHHKHRLIRFIHFVLEFFCFFFVGSLHCFFLLLCGFNCIECATLTHILWLFRSFWDILRLILSNCSKTWKFYKYDIFIETFYENAKHSIQINININIFGMETYLNRNIFQWKDMTWLRLFVIRLKTDWFVFDRVAINVFFINLYCTHLKMIRWNFFSLFFFKNSF